MFFSHHSHMEQGFYLNTEKTYLSGKADINVDKFIGYGTPKEKMEHTIVEQKTDTVNIKEARRQLQKYIAVIYIKNTSGCIWYSYTRYTF